MNRVRSDSIRLQFSPLRVNCIYPSPPDSTALARGLSGEVDTGSVSHLHTHTPCVLNAFTPLYPLAAMCLFLFYSCSSCRGWNNSVFKIPVVYSPISVYGRGSAPAGDHRPRCEARIKETDASERLGMKNQMCQEYRSVKRSSEKKLLASLLIAKRPLFSHSPRMHQCFIYSNPRGFDSLHSRSAHSHFPACLRVAILPFTSLLFSLRHSPFDCS